MKHGLFLEELAKELERREQIKRDFKSPTKLLKAEHIKSKYSRSGVDTNNFLLRFINGTDEISELPAEGFRVNQLAQNQIRTWAGIPAKYYELMKEKDPDLLLYNINRWFERKNEPRLIRTEENRVRAFLSNKYRCIDNFDIFKTVVPILLEESRMQLKIISCGLTESHLYLKVLSERLTFEVQVGDPVQVGLVISNSEVGKGSVAIEPLLYRLSCKNGAIISDRAMRKYHVGRYHEGINELTELFRDETRQANDQAFLMKLEDVTRAALKETNYDFLKNIVIDANTRKIEAGPSKVLERVTEEFGLRKEETEGVLQALITGGSQEMTQWGLANAVTWVANHRDEYERATELEKIGGRILTLPENQWKALAIED